jgi:DNA polymerase elongation subunit (family B)
MKGIIPGLLERWYAERKEMQAKKKTATTPEDTAFWDKRQLVKKINLNSLYGAILNAGCRFFDQRIGQSTTLTGRIIAKHMDATVNEAITGKYDHVGDSVIYGDTDSVYFSAWPAIKAEVEAGTMEWNKDICVQLYDTIADGVNESFPEFMERACHCPREMGAIIKGGRELVAYKGLFIKKKRYAVLIYDLEGKRLDVDGKPGKVKAMGLDLKRSDTPKIVQDFLSEILLDVLTSEGDDVRQVVIDKVRSFKMEFASKPAWEKGTPKRVNNLTKYTAAEKEQGKANMPGHVRAAMNWNNLKRMHGDNYSTGIVDGMKTIVCKLKDNPLGYTSVGYPTDEAHIPQWFKDLPFDNDLMETTIVDQKVENLLGVLEWKISESTDIKSTFDDLFTWE